MFNPINFISKFIKSSNQKELDRLIKIVSKVNEHESRLEKLKNEDFPIKTKEFKDRLIKGESLDKILPEVFACAREAAKRTINERPYDVQIIGSIVLHEGKIAEMKTGEGKTLSIALTAYLNALDEKGVHVVTVNDYLAKRDCLNMGQIFNFLGLKAGYINNDQDDYERKKNYECDITYATNSELGFDYLRDNMKFSSEEIVQRSHNFSIVDEIDSCLIDEARTPLVISGAAEDKTDKYLSVDNLIKHEKEITNYALEKLKKINSVKIIGNPKNKAGVIAFTIKGIHPHDIATILDDDGIAIRAGHHCCQIFHEKMNLTATARASIGVYNNKDDIDILCKAIENCRKIFDLK